ncbi:hypothetical protein [Ramlibacter sp. WS9]|uniref:hypothetical protein n=1 Tax=Ramlibacter sp. WS9 TaxID=1882741 RepID=UPI0011416A29|nr:hypothetical protein [Ramlibacter sp. WS9]ROZ64536.1 hypothetical protein EEB15_28265 [Ramlibacter sp. WS9]
MGALLYPRIKLLEGQIAHGDGLPQPGRTLNEDPMKTNHFEEGGEKPTGRGNAQGREPQPEQAPVACERRSRHRVADDQKSGKGSLSALSKMKMMQRRRDIVKPRHEEPDDDSPG